MKLLELKKDLYYVGVIDKGLEVFDVVMQTKYGSSYNSYLLKTNEGAVLFETCKIGFFDEYIENIKKICSLDDITYLVVNHTEPDHSGSVAALLELNPNIKIIGSRIAGCYLGEITNSSCLNFMEVKPGDSLTVGEYELNFVKAPFLHWPDSMYTYIPKLNSLITCDSFGAHFAWSDVLLSKMNKDYADYKDAFDFYYEVIFSPFKKYALNALEEVKKLDVDLICPGHGPVIDCDIETVLGWWKANSEIENVENKALVVYSSAYGYTGLGASQIEDTLKSQNMPFESFKIDVQNYPCLKEKILSLLQTSKYIFIGSPTINSDAIPLFYDLFASLHANFKKPQDVFVFGSYGWSGEAVKNLSDRLTQIKYNVVSSYRYKFMPSNEDKASLVEATKNLIK